MVADLTGKVQCAWRSDDGLVHIGGGAARAAAVIPGSELLSRTKLAACIRGRRTHPPDIVIATVREAQLVPD